MTITKDKVASLLVFCAMALSALMVLQPSGVPAANLFVGFMGALVGLTLIWFAESLGEIACFSRGIATKSPPMLIGAFGWLFLTGYPVLVAYVAR